MSLGNQIVTVAYNASVDSHIVNKRDVDIVPVGIYSGGYITYTSTGSPCTVGVSPFIAIIKDTQGNTTIEGDTQVRVETTTTIDLTNVTVNYYIVIRWAYTGAAGTDYADILAVATPSEDDLILGQVVLSSSSVSPYVRRSTPAVFDHLYRVEQKDANNVRVKAGRLNIGNSTVFKYDDNASTPISVVGMTAGQSRIDLVYLTYDGAIATLAGTAATTPTVPLYNGKMVLAEVTTSNTAITAIKDVRSTMPLYRTFIEPRTTDPQYPITGQIWMRTDVTVGGWGGSPS